MRQLGQGHLWPKLGRWVVALSMYLPPRSALVCPACRPGSSEWRLRFEGVLRCPLPPAAHQCIPSRAGRLLGRGMGLVSVDVDYNGPHRPSRLKAWVWRLGRHGRVMIQAPKQPPHNCVLYVVVRICAPC